MQLQTLEVINQALHNTVIYEIFFKIMLKGFGVLFAFWFLETF